MPNIVPFKHKVKYADLNGLLQEAVHISKAEIGREENGIFLSRLDFSRLLQARMAKTILEERQIGYGLFFCSLYVAKVFENFVHKVPESFYAEDYLVRSQDEKNPHLLQEGADVCCFISVFCESRSRWRAMQAKDFQKMGIGLYLAYYGETHKEIGWHMAKNFENIVKVAKRSLQTFSKN